MRQATLNTSLIIAGVCILAGAWMISSAINNSAVSGIEQVTMNQAS
ncbi:hypothetical protein [Halobacillus massiliensis]|nr:hypothetical protein [Halobacillus massiliensis]